MNILMIDNDRKQCDAGAVHLRRAGYAVDPCGDDMTAWGLLLRQHYDLVILDIDLLRLRGMELMREIRGRSADTAVLVLSSHDQVGEVMVNRGREWCAYLKKPFVPEVLGRKVCCMLGSEQRRRSSVLTAGALRLGPDTKIVYTAGGDVRLTEKECRVLTVFLRCPDRLISCRELEARVWNDHTGGHAGSVRNLISSLRRKLTPRIGYDPIRCKCGVGYLLQTENTA